MVTTVPARPVSSARRAALNPGGGADLQHPLPAVGVVQAGGGQEQVSGDGAERGLDLRGLEGPDRIDRLLATT
jgi:hypothetical protein